MPVLVNEKIDALLETTSRSFYPTLKYLPKKTRGQIGLLYLLARVADTIADSKVGETEALLRYLADYNDVVQGRATELPDFEPWQPFKPMNMKRSFSETSPWSLKD